MRDDVVRSDQSYAEIPDAGVGPTKELTLRVSVATLAKVVFDHPREGHPMLALERVATLREHERGQSVTVRAQPFGGAVRLRSSVALRELIGDFHFDSERSRSERDFRIQIRPSAWDAVKTFTLQQFGKDDAVLETSPDRELAEEFRDALGVTITPAQYHTHPLGRVIESEPTITENVRAVGSLTTRIYVVFRVRIMDPALAATMVTESKRYSDEDLRRLALKDARSGGEGRANGILALPVASVVAAYQAFPAQERNKRMVIDSHLLDENVPAVLEDVSAPRFLRLSGAAAGSRTG